MLVENKLLCETSELQGLSVIDAPANFTPVSIRYKYTERTYIVLPRGFARHRNLSLSLSLPFFPSLSLSLSSSACICGERENTCMGEARMQLIDAPAHNGRR